MSVKAFLDKTRLKKEKPEAEDYNDPPRPFIEHFIELRDCLIRCVGSWLVCVLVIAPFAPKIMSILQSPLAWSGISDKITVAGLDVTIGINMLIKIMFWGGTILSLPLILFFILRFIFPGLKTSERNMILVTLITAVFFFVAGVWMSFSFTLQVAIQMLMMISNWMNIPVPMLRIESYIEIVLKTILAFGIAFQIPLVLLILGWIGLISSETLREKRRYAIIMIFFLAMVLTPPDPLSQIIMAVPMCILYEICILLIRAREKIRGES